MAHIAEMPIVRSMHGYVLCEYALTFQKTHFHPYHWDGLARISDAVCVCDLCELGANCGEFEETWALRV